MRGGGGLRLLCCVHFVLLRERNFFCENWLRFLWAVALRELGGIDWLLRVGDIDALSCWGTFEVGGFGARALGGFLKAFR